MKQSDPIKLVDSGTLVRPGPIGRFVRLVVGIACLYALWEIIRFSNVASAQPFSTLDTRITLLFAPLCLLNYVVNIGFSKSWGHRPLLASLMTLGALAGIGFIITDSLDNRFFGIPLNLWLGYFYAHLGLSFILSAFIATPGCEMRAIPELFGRMSGKPSEEHHCPAAFISKIDEWEQSRTSG